MVKHRTCLYATCIIISTEETRSHISVSGKDNIGSKPITTLTLFHPLDLGVVYALTILSSINPIQQLSSCSSKDTVILHDDEEILPTSNAKQSILLILLTKEINCIDMVQHRKSWKTTCILLSTVVTKSHISVSEKDNIGSKLITTLTLIHLLDLGIVYALTILSSIHPR